MGAEIMLPSRREFLQDVERFNNEELARMYGVGLATITKWRRRYGVVGNGWKVGK